MREPLAKFFVKCSGGQKELIDKDYDKLMKLRNFFSRVSPEERKIAAGYIPTKQRLDSMSSELTISSGKNDQTLMLESQKKEYLFGKIVGLRHGSDFLRFDLKLSEEKEIIEKSNILILRVIRAIIKWNKTMPENGFLVFFPEMLQRQLSAFRI